ncbi:MAG: ThiF family adenylyltransferase [Verrucomicrobia bacterium]|nr:ThiF family adenylyltransferase [Verrucomicrobiota bacterium]
MTLLLVGAGVIGSYLAMLAGKLPRVRRLIILDRDVYTAGNVATQFVRPEHVGLPKAVALAGEIRRWIPGLRVDAIHAQVESVPLGLFRSVDVVLAALDSKRARCAVNEAAFRAGVPWLDGGVSNLGLARVTVFIPGAGPCYECQLGEADYASETVFPCAPADAPPSSQSPAYLGAMAAALEAAELSRLMTQGPDPALAGREVLLDCTSHRLLVSRVRARRDCRFDHEIFRVRPLNGGLRGTTVGDVLRRGRRPPGAENGVALSVPGKWFARRLACACGASRPVLRLKDRLQPPHLACRRCGGVMRPVGFDLTDRLEAAALGPAARRRSLASLGLVAGDVITIRRGARAWHYELRNGEPMP